MQIKNTTDFETKSVTKLVREICKASGLPLPSKLEFCWSRTCAWHGLATLGGSWIQIFVPRHVNEFVGKDCADLIVHELRHNTGLGHRDMDDNTDAIDLSKANTICVMKKPKKPIPTIDEIKRRRYEHVLEQIRRNETRAKRIDTQLKKLRRRKRYYESK